MRLWYQNLILSLFYTVFFFYKMYTKCFVKEIGAMIFLQCVMTQLVVSVLSLIEKLPQKIQWFVILFSFIMTGEERLKCCFCGLTRMFFYRSLNYLPLQSSPAPNESWEKAEINILEKKKQPNQPLSYFSFRLYSSFHFLI